MVQITEVYSLPIVKSILLKKTDYVPVDVDSRGT